MQELVVNVPAMYGDHHTLRVRQVLLAIGGVDDVTASSARRRVSVRFDEQTTSPEIINRALAEAGYRPDEILIPPVYPGRHEDGSAWHSLADRGTTTERKDREMAGDFRRY
jgi:hypothetical protein